MWGTKKPEEGTPSHSARENTPLAGAHDLRPLGARPASSPARLGKTLSVKGELAGNEELVLDGEFEGTIDLAESSLTVGPQGRVQADIRAREIVIEGSVRGNLRAADRLQISKSGNVVGDLVAARIVIEDGAYFKGSIDIQKPEEQKPRRAEAGGESFRIAPAPVAAAPKDKLQ
ncbi:MAG: polymer-forming cytoskeletal protein [Acidobacteria bacterium]|nr:polymer-forming cytoskeletal protein [Acidobacteriota bacterium]